MAALLRSVDSAPWILIAATCCALAVALVATGLSFDVFSAGPPLAACAVLVPLAIFYRVHRPDPKLATLLMTCAQLVAFMACAEPLSYALASADGRLWDDRFYAWDQALGLDWRAYLAFVDSHQWLGRIYSVTYDSLLLQFIVVILALALSGRLQASRAFVLAVSIAGIVTVAISAFAPAVAMYAHLGLHPKDYPHLNPSAAFVHMASLGGLRDGTLKVISLTNAEGIITFPSFHSALGVLFAWAFWQVPWLRWAGLTLNIIMIAATPIEGGHYFVDVIAGAFIAVFALRAASAIERRARGRLGRCNTVRAEVVGSIDDASARRPCKLQLQLPGQ